MTEGSDQCEDGDLLEFSNRVAMSKALPGQCCCDSIIFNQVAQSLQSPFFASGSNVSRRCDQDLRMTHGRGSEQSCHEPLCLVRGGFGRCVCQRGRQHSAATAWTPAVSANRLVRCVETTGLGLPKLWKWAHLAALLVHTLKADDATEGTCEKKDIVDKPDHIDTVFLVMVLLGIYGSVTLTLQIYKMVWQSQAAILAAMTTKGTTAAAEAAAAAEEVGHRSVARARYPVELDMSSATPGLAVTASAAAAVKLQQRTVAVQTEYTFKWWWAAPRLERLREGFWGAWPQ